MEVNVDRSIEHIAIGALTAAKRNARTHSKRQLKQIAASITRFGFTNPVLIDDDNNILAGHGRVEAAKELGLATAPCVRLKNLSAAEKRAYVIADNKLALNSGWDVEILAGELQALIEIDFDICITGFENAEVDMILGAAAEASPQPTGPEDEHVAPSAADEAITCAGDLWILGKHRLLCGDAKDHDCVARLVACMCRR
jgi:hypothetical protein